MVHLRRPGSVIGRVDPSGNVTYSAKYDVYGAVRSATGTANTAQGFVGGCGHLSEAATGLIYMRARYYDPNTGRFVSQDPSMHSVNWYIYCMDNPANNVDADGKETTPFEVAMQIAGIITAALYCDLFKATLGVCFTMVLLSILAPLAFVAGGGWMFPVGIPYGIAFGYMAAQAILNMCSELSAYAGSTISGIQEGGTPNMVKEILLTVEGYVNGINLIMEADEADQELNG